MTVSIGPSLIVVSNVSGINGLGAISAPGLKVGDTTIAVLITSGGVPANAGIGGEVEIVVSIADEIQQIDSGNLSAKTFDIYLVRLQ